MSSRPGPAPLAVGVVAVVVATAIVALGFSLRTEELGPTAPVPAVERVAPDAGADVLHDLATALPSSAAAVAGTFAAGPGGASVATAPQGLVAPLVSIPLDGPPWATATVEGTAVDGWSVAFGIDGPGSYWAATLHRAAGTAELVRVVQGQPTTIATRPLPGPAEARAVVRWQGRQVQVDLGGAPLPTVTVRSVSAPAIGLLGRGAAGQPGAARWASVAIEASDPLAPALLPPLLDARHVTADEARRTLGG